MIEQATQNGGGAVIFTMLGIFIGVVFTLSLLTFLSRNNDDEPANTR